MKKVQVTLQSDNAMLTCWVEPKVTAGNYITLKDSDDPHRLWKVLSVGEPKEVSEIKTRWKVGGL